MKKKINTINGKRLVIGNANEITKDEILVQQTKDGTVSLKERVGGELKELTSAENSNQDTPSTSNEQIIKFYKINHMYDGVNYAGKWRELLTPFVQTREETSNNGAFISTCLYSGTISSYYGNVYFGIVAGSGENLDVTYVSDSWSTHSESEPFTPYSLLSFLKDKTIEGIPNLLDCVTEVSNKEFFTCNIY
jgi:hypothetical protein